MSGYLAPAGIRRIRYVIEPVLPSHSRQNGSNDTGCLLGMFKVFSRAQFGLRFLLSSLGMVNSIRHQIVRSLFFLYFSSTLILLQTTFHNIH
jgi:hypothetical protein